MPYIKVNPDKLKDNPFSILANEWMLVTAGNREDYNMMTASWGGFGVMWKKDVAVTVVRPQRYTYEFLEKNDTFTLSFYGSRKDLHKICGAKSGRDINKTKEAGLTPVFTENGIYFETARLVLVCKKMYVSDINPDNFVDKAPLSLYDNDFHRMYVGEILEVLVEQ